MALYNGITSMNKASGLTSHDVIDCLRRITGQKKIGHTGTLDPMATGLLLICFGRATKLTQFLTDWDKSYRAEITLGFVSNTLDRGGKIEASGAVPEISEQDMEVVLDRFRGKIKQKIPAYSAVKVDGRELYKYARKGQEVETPTREIEITSLKLLSFESPVLKIEVACSKGTYIRTLADDIGREIGCGAYLSGLERIAVGPFKIDAATTLPEVEEFHKSQKFNDLVKPIEQVLDFPIIGIRRMAAETICNGGLIKSDDIVSRQNEFDTGALLSIADENGQILAIGKATCDSVSLAAGENKSFFTYVRVLS